MTVVNRFNVNKQQVTLDADIIENMSANDVSYNDSSQYKESTVGKKLSDLVLEVNELIKSIDRIHKSFKVETNNKAGYIYIDGVKKTIPANSIRTFRFNNTFASNTYNNYNSNPGIASFHFLVTDTSEITSMEKMFYGCKSLTSLDLSNFDTSVVTNMSGMFYDCSSLTSLLLGPNFFKTSKKTSIDFSLCSKWTNDTVVNSLVTNSYNRVAAGINTLTLKLHANTKAALTDEQKATITAKGYTIA